MVYSMLMEASASPDPDQFTQSDLYRRCVAAGVVPATEADLISGGRETAAPEVQLPPAAESDTLPMRLTVSGMWCPACAWVIETALTRLDGVAHAACDYASDRLLCRYDPKATDPNAIHHAVQRLGYTLSENGGDAARAMVRKEFIRLAVCLFLSANVMMLSWSLYSGFFTFLSDQDIRYISWPIVVFATMVMVYGGWPLLQKALGGLRSAAPGMETLVCIGAGSAYTYSLVSFGAGSLHLYFDTATMLITLVLLGKMLESRAKRNVSRDLEGFLALQPNKVRICGDQYPEGRFVALAQLVPGDRFRVKENEIVAADGRVVAGVGTVDTSAVTGESQPERVKSGGGVTSGTRLISGDITIEASRVGDDALLGQMIRIIETSLVGRTPLESRTDRWLTLFIPLIVGLGAATVVVGHGLGLSWEQAFVRGLTVLVIACPCALGIAIPLARVAGISGAGRMGILVRDFEAFERAMGMDCVVMDKTGTVTHGRWALNAVIPLVDRAPEALLALAAGLESGVDHEVARAVHAAAREKKIDAIDISRQQVEVNGVCGFHNGDELRLGARAFALPNVVIDAHQPISSDGSSQLYLSANGVAWAILEFGDALRQGMQQTIARLAGNGAELHLISGDGPATTQAVARQLGIAHFRGGLLPDQKADYVTRLKANGAGVVMVGDGINDAPALAVANLSVAVHRHAALTRQAAAVTLMRSNPSQLLDFFELAQAVNAKIAQNLGCAWGYNLLSIPIAMSGWLNPLIAATAMLLSSLTVIGNTLLLVHRRRDGAAPRSG